jgi:hypothetical protein
MFNMVDFTFLCLEQPFSKLTTNNANIPKPGPRLDTWKDA